MFYNLCHCNNRSCPDSVILFYLCKCTLGTLTSFHSVNGYNKSCNINVTLCFDDRESLIYWCSCCCYIFYYYNLIAILDRASEKDSLIAVVFYFFTVRTVSYICPIFIVKCYSCGNRKRYTLICRSEQNIKICSVLVINSLCIIFAKFLKLCTCSVRTCINKEGCLSCLLYTSDAADE